MTIKEVLHRVIDGLSEEEAQEFLGYLNLQADPDTLSDEEAKLVKEGEQAISRGDVVRYESLDELRRELGLGA